MGINLSDAHRNKTWARNHQSMEIETPQQDVRINCWGAISFQGATSLSIYKETMKQGLYQEVLEEHRPEMDLYPGGWYLFMTMIGLM